MIIFFDNVIDWMLANTDDAPLEYKSSLLQCHLDACNATLAQALYCEPGIIVIHTVLCLMTQCTAVQE